MIPSRSPYLQAMPPGAIPVPARQRFIRNAVFWGSALTLTGLWRLAQTNYLADTLLAKLMFAAHDHLYLPMVGWLVTRFFPFSLIWCGLAATAGLLLLFHFLTGKAPVRHPYTALAAAMIRTPLLRAPLATTCQKWTSYGAAPALLTQTALHEYRCMVRNLMDHTTVQRSDLQNLQSLTDLVLDLLFCIPDQDSAQSADNAQQALIVFRQTKAMIRVLGEGRPLESAEKTVARFQQITRALGQSELETNPDAHPWRMATLLEDLAMVLLLDNPEASGLLPTPRSPVRCRQQLVHHLDQRLALLSGLRQDLEGVALRRRLRANHFAQLPPADDVNPATGPLIIGLALDAAAVLNEPKWVLGYLDAAAGLQFALDLLPPESDTPPGQQVDQLNQLPAGSFDLVTAGLSARLDEKEYHHYRGVVADWPAQSTSLLEPTDFHGAETRSAHLRLAGGSAE